MRINKIGDAIAQVHSVLSYVYSFGCRHDTETKTYPSIQTINRQPLELSLLHLIFETSKVAKSSFPLVNSRLVTALMLWMYPIGNSVPQDC